MKLQTKLVLNSMISILIALIIMLYIILTMFGMQKTAKSFSDVLVEVEQLNSSLASYQLAIGNYGRNPTESNRLMVVTRHEDMLEQSDRLGTLHTDRTNARETQRVQFIGEKVEQIRSGAGVVIEEGNTVEAMKLSSKLFGVMNDVYLLKLALNEQYEQLSRTNNQRLFAISIISGVILLVASGAVSLFITRRTVRPIQLLSAYSRKISEGDLEVAEVDHASDDEVGQLTRSFNLMKRSLAEMIERIQRDAGVLKEHNERIRDSIHYAERIQRSMFPSEDQLPEEVREHFLIWKPRDVVGGDFYWWKRSGHGVYIAVGDCTGHGVPGALMTTLSISALNRLADQEERLSPAHMLDQMNEMIKHNLHKDNEMVLSDDGLDLALLYIEKGTVTFAGSKLSLYVKDGPQVVELRGDRKSIGYKRTPGDYRFHEQQVTVLPDTVLYITTDGFLDQNGGEQDYSFGRRRFARLLQEAEGLSLAEQKSWFLSQLDEYKGNAGQRDDITLLGLKLK